MKVYLATRRFRLDDGSYNVQPIGIFESRERAKTAIDFVMEQHYKLNILHVDEEENFIFFFIKRHRNAEVQACKIVEMDVNTTYIGAEHL